MAQMKKLPHISVLFLVMPIAMIFHACSKETAEPSLKIKVVYDQNQVRLNNIGQPAPMPADHAGQTPEFRDFRINSIELAPSQFTLPGQGVMIYQAPETQAGGSTAIDFDRMTAITDGSFKEDIRLDAVPPGTYTYLRVSVAYQNAEVRFNLLNTAAGDLMNQKGNISSFLGYNTYISSVTPHSLPLSVNANKLQGFWAFETRFSPPLDLYNQVFSGQAPEGATTVVNPLAGIADIPPGSCIITGAFDSPLVISGQEEEDRSITLSFSVDRSFEWVDSNGNDAWDIDAGGGTIEQVVDMGLRGLMVFWE